MGDLKLPNLRIQNFRCYRDVKINQLGRVNLIVGKNNVGKTSLLEAIELYVRLNRPNVINEILQGRDLSNFDERRSVNTSRFDVSIPAARQLFYGPPDLENVVPGDSSDIDSWPVIKITGPEESTKQLRVKLEGPSDNYELYLRYYIDEEPNARLSTFLGHPKPRCTLLPSECSRSKLDIQSVWQSIQVTPSEEKILDALKIVDERIEVVRMIGGAASGDGRSKGIPTVRLRDKKQPEPLKNLGQGAVRMFEMGLAALDARDNFLLIDEVEDGIHHSIQQNLWRLLFDMAASQNIQVFATTHSLDAVKAFEKVANEQKEEDGVLVQLRRRRSDDDIVAVTSEEEELKEALSLNVDPR